MPRNSAFLLLVYLLLSFSNKSNSQTLKSQEILHLWNAPIRENDRMLKEKGFRDVYGGPKKLGGFIYLLHHNTAREYLFIHTNDSGKTTSVIYYLPTKEIYLKQLKAAKNLGTGELVLPTGATIYEDGKKYYQIVYRHSDQ